MDGVPGLSRDVHVTGRRRIIGPLQRIDICLLERFHPRTRVAVGSHERPQHQPLPEGPQPDRLNETVSRHLSLVSRGYEEITATLTLVGTGETEITHRSHPLVVQETEHTGRDLDHHRPRLGVRHRHPIDRLRVPGQRQSVGIRMEHHKIGRSESDSRRNAWTKPQIAAAIMCRRNT